METHVTWSFGIVAALTLAGAVAAVTLRNLVHCALALAAAFAGLAGLYLQLGAQFVGFAQVLVYIGAVSMLMVFAILLTRGAEPPSQGSVGASWPVGVLVAVLVFAVLGGAILRSQVGSHAPPGLPQAAVRDIGGQLMTKYILALEVLGLLLTAALIGAVVLALRERRSA